MAACAGREPSDKAAMMKKLFNVTRAQRFRRVDNVAIAISLQTLKCSTMLVSGLPRSAAATAKSCKMLLRLSTGPAWLRLRNYVWDGRSRGLRFRTGMTRCPLAVYLCEHLFKMGWFPSPEYTEQATTLTEQYCSHLAGGCRELWIGRRSARNDTSLIFGDPGGGRSRSTRHFATAQANGAMWWRCSIRKHRNSQACRSGESFNADSGKSRR